MNDLMTAGEVAEYLRLDVATVVRWARDGKLPAVKIGKAYRVRRDDLESWYEAKRTA